MHAVERSAAVGAAATLCDPHHPVAVGVGTRGVTPAVMTAVFPTPRGLPAGWLGRSARHHAAQFRPRPRPKLRCARAPPVVPRFRPGRCCGSIQIMPAPRTAFPPTPPRPPLPQPCIVCPVPQPTTGVPALVPSRAPLRVPRCLGRRRAGAPPMPPPRSLGQRRSTRLLVARVRQPPSCRPTPRRPLRRRRRVLPCWRRACVLPRRWDWSGCRPPLGRLPRPPSLQAPPRGGRRRPLAAAAVRSPPACSARHCRRRVGIPTRQRRRWRPPCQRCRHRAPPSVVVLPRRPVGFQRARLGRARLRVQPDARTLV